jgi:hypothetical protein
LTACSRPIKVVKKDDVPKLKHNPRLGEIKITKWKQVKREEELREEWLAEHAEKEKREREQVFASTESGAD